MKKIAVIMGSDSDLSTMSKAADTLKELGIPFEVHIFSAHRTPDEAKAFSAGARADGFAAIIAAAGMAAHLAGAIAANTTLPVIGVPIKSGGLGGIDSLLSTVQMPSGIPVATVGIDGAVNAALLCAEIIAVSDGALAERLEAKRAEGRSRVLEKNKAVEEQFNNKLGELKMEKKELLYEGKAKKVYATEDPDYVIVSYKDDATAFDGLKKGTIAGKGVINNRMSNYLCRLLEKHGVKTHYVEELNDRETVVKKVSIVPLEVIIRNISAGSFAKRYGVEEGIVFDSPTIEFSYKNDDLHDPLINEYHALALKLAAKEEIDEIIKTAFRINEVLKEYFLSLDVKLVDFKLEFGRLADGTVVLADEISPDTCRFWDAKTNEKLDKDRFRRDLGGVEDAYNEMMKRVFGE